MRNLAGLPLFAAYAKECPVAARLEAQAVYVPIQHDLSVADARLRATDLADALRIALPGVPSMSALESAR